MTRPATGALLRRELDAARANRQAHETAAREHKGARRAFEERMGKWGSALAAVEKSMTLPLAEGAQDAVVTAHRTWAVAANKLRPALSARSNEHEGWRRGASRMTTDELNAAAPWNDNNPLLDTTALDDARAAYDTALQKQRRTDVWKEINALRGTITGRVPAVPELDELPTGLDVPSVQEAYSKAAAAKSNYETAMGTRRQLTIDAINNAWNANVTPEGARAALNSVPVLTKDDLVNVEEKGAHDTARRELEAAIAAAQSARDAAAQRLTTLKAEVEAMNAPAFVYPPRWNEAQAVTYNKHVKAATDAIGA